MQEEDAYSEPLYDSDGDTPTSTGTGTGSNSSSASDEARSGIPYAPAITAIPPNHAPLPATVTGKVKADAIPSEWKPPPSLPSTIPQGIKFPLALTVTRGRYGLHKPYPAVMSAQLKAIEDMACTPGPNMLRKDVGFSKALSSDTWHR